jgi:hypothetical protein
LNFSKCVDVIGERVNTLKKFKGGSANDQQLKGYPEDG